LKVLRDWENWLSRPSAVWLQADSE